MYVFPRSPACASVSESVPGSRDYTAIGGRVVAAGGTTTQLTNAADVVAQASSLVGTRTRFACPLIRSRTRR